MEGELAGKPVRGQALGTKSVPLAEQYSPPDLRRSQKMFQGSTRQVLQFPVPNNHLSLKKHPEHINSLALQQSSHRPLITCKVWWQRCSARQVWCWDAQIFASLLNRLICACCHSILHGELTRCA